MRFLSTLRAYFVAVVVALGANSAWAQGYTVVSASAGSQYVAPPSGSVDYKSSFLQSGTANLDDGTFSISTPFPIPYFGTNYSTIVAGTNGQVWIAGSVSTTVQYYYNYSAIPIPITSAGAQNDGIVKVAQFDNYGNLSNSHFYYWTDGSAPTRRFICHWDNWSTYSYGGSLTYQVQFYETGKIVMSYNPNAWTPTSSGPAMGVGLDAVGNGGYAAPNNNGSYTFAPNSTAPSDWIYQLPLQITGKVLFDRYITDATGIGQSSEYGLPLSGIVVAEQTSAGVTVGTGVTDSAGNFNISGSPITNGSIAVLSGTTACNVRKTAISALYSATLLTGRDFTTSNSISVGTLTLGEGLDPGGVNRGPINIARTLQTVYDWARARAPTKTIQLVDPVLYDTSSALPTSYTAKNGSTLASMRVASALSGNPDQWDVSVLRKVYARHILGAIAGDPVTAYDATFDKTTDDQNAFAEGFGYYMNAIISRDTKYFDATSSTAVTAIDMESPANLPATKGSNIAGWCAAALYDLTDGGTNESWDTFDGSGAAGEQVFLAAASLSTQATAGTFFTAWVTNKGYDGTALARDFIRHGLLPDDADEPNDYPSEATPIVQFGFVRKDRALTQFNDDYYKFTMAYPTNVLTVDCVYDRVVYSSAVVLLELQNSAGAVLATGSPLGASGAIEAKSGALPAGDYVIRVKLTAGGPLPKYALQAFSELAFTSGTFPTWTVGRPINVPVNITGGIPPYDLVVPTTFKKPEGLVLDGVNLRVTGTPTGPQDAPIPPGGSHVYPFILSAVDSATPTRNSASGSVTFTVNDALKQHFSPFLAFAFGKPVDRPAPFAGGTPPYTASIGQGALPHGVAAEGGAALRFTGTPDSPGSYAFTMTGTDIAGSADTASTTGVACLPLGQQAALAPGASACGFYFDAVKGSTVSLTVATVRQPGKRAAPRALRATILDVDGSTVLVEPKTKATRGRVAGGKFVAPSTGRFYFVVSSDDAGAQALLSVKARTVANKGGKGDGGPKNLVSGGAPFNVEIGAIGGAVLTFTAKPERFSGLLIQAAHLLDPAGRQINFADGEVNERPDGSITFRRTLPISGTWTVVLAAYPGPQGKFTYAFTVKEPPGAVFSAD